MIIAGAGGHAKEILDIISNEKSICFYDSTDSIEESLFEFKILKSSIAVESHFEKDARFCLGVGNSKTRETLANELLAAGGNLISVIAENAEIGKFDVVIEKGVNIMQLALVSSSSIIRKGVLINAKATVHHDVEVKEYTEIGPGARILGGAKVGKFCQIGANAVVLPNIEIGDYAIIGAGAVVTKNVPSNSVSVGVPSKIISKE